jgi:hypothetical protein
LRSILIPGMCSIGHPSPAIIRRVPPTRGNFFRP